MPERVVPIVAIGAGAIVRNAHWPAYELAGFPVFGVFDTDQERAGRLAADFSVANVFGSLNSIVEQAPKPCVFDIAVPASEILPILNCLPDGVAVLIQKPMGEDLSQADSILQTCRDKRLIAAVNFQLRSAPYAIAARELILSGDFGDLHEIDVKVNVHTPWALWPFLASAPRMEIVYHSIHYLDLIRSLMGEPARVYGRTIKHPRSPNLHSARSAIILDYGDWKRATVVTNHGHEFGPDEQESYIRFECEKGCVKFQMGLNLDYPSGGADRLRYIRQGDPAWTEAALEGSWIPHAFIGTMASVMRGLDGEPMPTSVEDAWHTMKLVERCYESDASGRPA